MFPNWADKKVFDIKRSDVLQLLRLIKRDNGTTQSLAVLATISGVLSWYAGENDDFNSPINRATRKKIDTAHI